MKHSSAIFSAFLFLLSTTAQSKIVLQKEKLFLEHQGSRTPLGMVNDLIQSKVVSNVKLYKKGDVHLLSFAKKNEPEKLYSVDEKGFVYSIEPFSSYQVSEVDNAGRIKFKEVPNRKYYIDSKGFFLY